MELDAHVSTNIFSKFAAVSLYVNLIYFPKTFSTKALQEENFFHSGKLAMYGGSFI